MYVHTLAEHSEDEIVEANESEVGEANGRLENINVTDVPSDISEGELHTIVSKYDLAPDYKLFVPRQTCELTLLWITSPSCYMERAFALVFCFLPKPLKSLFNDYEITNIQLHPNDLRLLCGIYELARRDGTTLTDQRVGELYRMYHRVNEDHCFFQAKRMTPKNAKGSKMSKLAKVMKKKSGTDSSKKGRPVVIINPLAPKPETAQKSPSDKPTPLSPPVAPSHQKTKGGTCSFSSSSPTKAGEPLDI
ncbi:hypothetical protein JCGZ_22823 [Jatropha curcas]|uniref:Uncharacterized protein n=1 Tax=Jatropha curcas TaxID=180498 RepID=A0A067L492_JATCU|nr:hypothetical protein JCGZ_22823 [Jatropha curcas]